MSRVGLNPIIIPEGVEYSFVDNLFVAKSQKGDLSLKLDLGFKIIENNTDNNIVVQRPNDNKESKAKHGLYRSLIFNIFEGLSKGQKTMIEMIYTINEMEKSVLKNEVRFLILDEPEYGLSPEAREVVKKILLVIKAAMDPSTTSHLDFNPYRVLESSHNFQNIVCYVITHEKIFNDLSKYIDCFNEFEK